MPEGATGERRSPDVQARSGEPRTRRGRETRERILNAAAELIHVKGVHGTSVDDVLERSGTGKGQFYHYFDGKAELIREVLHHQIGREFDRDRRFLERLDSWEGIEAWFDRIVESQVRTGFLGGCPIGSIAAEMADQDDELRLELTEAFDLKKAWLLEGLNAMKERGELAADADPEELADFALATIQGGLILATTRKDEGPLRRALTEALRHLRSFEEVP
ncbi:MAG: TetR family transcriptional regulator [Gemmatimonadetes bacterium]|nr:helix-turn-helix transcriptional regulator [Gemmatimonadota bacterium]NIR80790.1 helix-turn-helix transcriptional regulator [Gemmatimonadota bacterium]NIT89610.1 helix-turn-helix transcriptional regulator [Gemmatimonadota bacterium]NIU33390.1 helix-turn-helix transcriptional regulator [Gemmatimonadota bacterium]NIU37682.1 TetR family transcriptional regulator [Gemmatimonadota bacterium]